MAPRKAPAKAAEPTEEVDEAPDAPEEGPVPHKAVTGRPNDTEIVEPFIPGSTFASRKRLASAQNKAVKASGARLD